MTTVQPHETRWTVVSNAGKGAAEALAELFRAYRPAVIEYIHVRGHRDAEDLAHGFFAEIMGSDFLAKADRKRGRFRHYLFGGVRNYLAKQHRDASTEKRGAKVEKLSLDFREDDADLPELLIDGLTPEDVFEKRWQQVLLARARRALRAEYERRNKAARFDALAPYLRHEAEPGEYATLAPAIGLSVSGIASAVERMRQRYADLVRHEVADTCSPQDFAAEWDELDLELL